MGYFKKEWKARRGIGLNKYSIDGAAVVPLINIPDNVTEVGDAFSTQNMNNLEDRIGTAVDGVERLVMQKFQTLPVVIYNNKSSDPSINWACTGGFKSTKGNLSLEEYDLLEVYYNYDARYENTLYNYSKVVIVTMDRLKRLQDNKSGAEEILEALQRKGDINGVDTMGSFVFRIHKSSRPEKWKYSVVATFVELEQLMDSKVTKILGYKRLPITEIPTVNIEPSLITETQQGSFLSISDTDEKREVDINHLTNKNIIDFSKHTLSNTYVVYNDDNLTATGLAPANTVGVRHATFRGVPFEVGKEYTIIYTQSSDNGENSPSSPRIGNNSGLGLKFGEANSVNKYTFTCTRADDFMYFYTHTYTQEYIQNMVYSDIMIIEGNSNTIAYIPYLPEGTSVDVIVGNANLLDLENVFMNRCSATNDVLLINTVNELYPLMRFMSPESFAIQNNTTYYFGFVLNSIQSTVAIVNSGMVVYYADGSTQSALLSIDDTLINKFYEYSITTSNKAITRLELRPIVTTPSLSSITATISNMIISTTSFKESQYIKSEYQTIPVTLPMTVPIYADQYEEVTNIYSSTKGIILDVTAKLDSNVVMARHLTGEFASRPTDTKPYPRYYIATDTIIPLAGTRQSFLDKRKSGINSWIKIS